MWPEQQQRSSPSSSAAAVASLLLLSGMLTSAGAAGVKVFTAYFQRLSRERGAARGGGGGIGGTAPTTTAQGSTVLEPLSPADLFVAVKSTGRFHRPRLELLLDTWMSRSIQQVRKDTHGKPKYTDFIMTSSVRPHLVQFYSNFTKFNPF